MIHQAAKKDWGLENTTTIKGPAHLQRPTDVEASGWQALVLGVFVPNLSLKTLNFKATFLTNNSVSTISIFLV